MTPPRNSSSRESEMIEAKQALQIFDDCFSGHPQQSYGTGEDGQEHNAGICLYEMSVIEVQLIRESLTEADGLREALDDQRSLVKNFRSELADLHHQIKIKDWRIEADAKELAALKQCGHIWVKFNEIYDTHIVEGRVYCKKCGVYYMGDAVTREDTVNQAYALSDVRTGLTSPAKINDAELRDLVIGEMCSDEYRNLDMDDQVNHLIHFIRTHAPKEPIK